MATKKETAKKAPAVIPAKREPDAIEGVASKESTSQTMAKLVTTSSALSAFTLKQYSGAGDGMESTELGRVRKVNGAIS